MYLTLAGLKENILRDLSLKRFKPCSYLYEFGGLVCVNILMYLGYYTFL